MADNDNQHYSISLSSMSSVPRRHSDEIHRRPTAPRITQKRNLKWWDVFSLIINKMIGTGIFTGPFLTLSATGSKTLTLVFWFLGFIYTVFSMWLYLECARDIPYTGGELIYLDHIWKKPRLLLYTLYTFYCITIYGSSTNALQFGRQVILAATATTETSIKSSNGYDIDRRLMCFLGVVVTAFACLMLYFSAAKSRAFNLVTAVLKIVLLVVVAIAGCRYVATHASESAPWGSSLPMGDSNANLGWSQGIILVFFSYHGWENATFIAGEIPNWHALRSGFIAAVAVVGSLYVIIAGIVCAAVPSDPELFPLFENYPAMFFGGTPKAIQAAAIIVAISALGNMVSIIYTCIRVKQIMGWPSILPLSNLWRRSDLARKMRTVFSHRPAETYHEAVERAIIVRKGTPEGGIMIHFMFSVIQIAVTQAIRDTRLAINFFGTAMIWGHFVFESLVALGFALRYIPNDAREREVLKVWNAPVAPAWFTNRRIGPRALGTLIFLTSLFISTVVMIENPGYWYGIVNFAVIAVALVYWRFFVSCYTRLRNIPLFGITISEKQHGQDSAGEALRQCSLCPDISEVHRHREDGYVHYNEVEFEGSIMGSIMSSAGEAFSDDVYTVREVYNGRDVGESSSAVSLPLESSHQGKPRTSKIMYNLTGGSNA